MQLIEKKMLISTTHNCILRLLYNQKVLCLHFSVRTRVSDIYCIFTNILFKHSTKDSWLLRAFPWSCRKLTIVCLPNENAALPPIGRSESSFDLPSFLASLRCSVLQTAAPSDRFIRYLSEGIIADRFAGERCLPMLAETSRMSRTHVVKWSRVVRAAAANTWPAHDRLV